MDAQGDSMGGQFVVILGQGGNHAFTLSFGAHAALITDNLSIFSLPLVHASIELCSLVLIATMQVLRTRWTGWRAFFGHKRTAIKVLALIVMIMEALGMNFSN